jgi:hypothetical protein
MKALLAVIFLTSASWAHGPVSQQSIDAATVAVAHFNKVHPHDVRRQFKSLSAELTSHERFSIQLSLQNGQTFLYDCQENESVKPVVWECRTLN